jgi:hypothetical protein
MEISNACSWDIFKPVLNFTLKIQGQHPYIYIIIFNLIKVKEIFKILDVFFCKDIHILSIKLGKIITIIGKEVMEKRRQKQRLVSVWDFHSYMR